MVQQNISLLLGLSHSDSSIMGLKKCLVYRIFRGSSKKKKIFPESNFKDSWSRNQGNNFDCIKDKNWVKKSAIFSLINVIKI